MSILHVRHLQTKLEQLYNDRLIDMNDVKTKNPEEIKQQFLSRALAAYSLHILALAEIGTTATAIVDGYEDNGIDAIYYDEAKKVLWLIQSKWINNGNGEPSPKDTQAFCTGIRDLIEYKIERFNEKIKQKEPLIQLALDDANVKFNIVLAHTGNQFGEHNQRCISDLIAELNDPSELCSFINFNLKSAHQSLVDTVDGTPINVDVAISNWGAVSEPYEAYYGQINLKEISKWWIDNGTKLVSENIRGFIGATEVNEEIIKTIKNNPNHFWYYNNGITALCDSIKKKPLGGSDRAMGIFEICGLKVVNGAQTVGTIGEYFKKNADIDTDATVMTRFISLKNCPDDFAVQVTKATNTQNKVEKKDFVALDPQQENLRTNFALEGINYQYKRSSDNLLSDDNNCSFEELIVALACSNNNIDHCITAKREVGKLWEDVTRIPYIELFNPSVTTNRAWNSIYVHREVASYLKSQAGKFSGRQKGIYIHANLFIEHMVFKLIDQKNINGDKKEFKTYADKIIKDNVEKIASNIFSYVDAEYSTSLIHQLFRNFTKTRAIEKYLDNLQLTERPL